MPVSPACAVLLPVLGIGDYISAGRFKCPEDPSVHLKGPRSELPGEHWVVFFMETEAPAQGVLLEYNVH